MKAHVALLWSLSATRLAAAVWLAARLSDPVAAITCDGAAASKRLTFDARAAWAAACRAELATTCERRADRRRLVGTARAGFVAVCRADVANR